MAFAFLVVLGELQYSSDFKKETLLKVSLEAMDLSFQGRILLPILALRLTVGQLVCVDLCMDHFRSLVR